MVALERYKQGYNIDGWLGIMREADTGWMRFTIGPPKSEPAEVGRPN